MSLILKISSLIVLASLIFWQAGCTSAEGLDGLILQPNAETQNDSLDEFDNTLNDTDGGGIAAGNPGYQSPEGSGGVAAGNPGIIVEEHHEVFLPTEDQSSDPENEEPGLKEQEVRDVEKIVETVPPAQTGFIVNSPSSPVDISDAISNSSPPMISDSPQLMGLFPESQSKDKLQKVDAMNIVPSLNPQTSNHDAMD